MQCSFNDIKAFTTWADVKQRLWMIIDIDYWGLHDSKQDNPQRIFLQRVGGNERLNITAASLIEEVTKNNMYQVTNPVPYKK